MPSRDFNELIESLSQAKTVEDLHAACSALCEQYGFDRFIYGARFPSSFVKPSYVFISGYPTEWRSHYIAENFQEIDPTVTHCYSHVTPIGWEQILAQEKQNHLIHRFMGEAREFGLNSGVSFPIHSNRGESAMLSLASERSEAQARTDILHVMPYAQLFITYLHEAARKIFEQQVLPLKQAHLTNRERQCLLWAAEGKTTWETSVILGVAERTVRFHLRNASEKLNVVSRQHAVARAVSLGLINPHIS